MDVIIIFIKTLCDINLNQDSHNTLNSIYEILEILDIDLHEKYVKNNDKLPFSIRVKIVDLIEFYCLKADEYINKYSDKECYEFLRELKTRAKEVSAYIGLI